MNLKNMLKKYITFVALSISIYSCLSNDNGVRKEKDENGIIRRKVYSANEYDQVLIEEFDEKGVINLQYYKKNNQYDSIVKYYKDGLLYKSIDVNQQGELSGKMTVFRTSGSKYAVFGYQNDKREGWMTAFDESGDTTLLNYFVNDQNHYVRQKKYKDGVVYWQESYIPLIKCDVDSTLTSHTINGVFDLPLPDSIFHLNNFKIGFYETTNPEIINHPDSFINYDIPLSEMTNVAIPSKFSVSSDKPIQKIFLCQILQVKDGSIVRYNFIKKKLIFSDK